MWWCVQISKLLVVNPKERLTAAEALNHPFFKREEVHVCLSVYLSVCVCVLLRQDVSGQAAMAQCLRRVDWRPKTTKNGSHYLQNHAQITQVCRRESVHRNGTSPSCQMRQQLTIVIFLLLMMHHIVKLKNKCTHIQFFGYSMSWCYLLYHMTEI